MIRYTQGNLLESPAEALVNTVNELGVMGKGIALQFRDAFSVSARAYEKAAKSGQVRVGHMLVTHSESLIGPRLIIHFPTKKHWRNSSQIEWVRDGLQDLVRVIKEENIQSIAVPSLGCGNGGLQWAIVRKEIERALSSLDDVDVTVYEPTSRYQNSPKSAGLEVLTPARALVAELIRRYAVLGLECSILEVQKLAWFLTRSIKHLGLPDVLDWKFVADKYGPYSDRLRFLLDHIDGSYLHSEKRLADAKPLDVVRFDDERREEVAAYLLSGAAKDYRPALELASEVIEGFESPLGMELLATVDWLIAEQHVDARLDAVKKAVSEWPAGAPAAARKQHIFDDRLLGLALERLSSTELAASS